MEDVRITGVRWNSDLPVWSTEETQDRIRELIQTSTLFEKETIDLHKKESKTTERFRKKVLDHHKETTSTTSGAFRQLGDKIIKAYLSGGASLEKVYRDTAKSMVSNLSKIPFLGVPLGIAIAGFEGLVHVLQQTHGAFLELYDTGISVNTSLTDLMMTAGRARMSLGDLASVGTKYSGAIQTLTTDTQFGIQAFAELTNTLRQSLMPIGMLGLQTSEINEYLGEYLETQRLIGRNESIDEHRRANAVREYLQQLTELSQITGKQRRAIQDELNAIMRDEGFAAYLRTLPEDVRVGMMELINEVQTIQGDVAGQSARMIAQFNIEAFDRQTALYASMANTSVDTIRELMDRVRSGAKLTDADLSLLRKTLIDDAKQITSEQGEYLGAITTFGADGIREVLAGLLNASALNIEALNRANTEFDDELLKFMNNFQEIVNRLVGSAQELGARLLKVIEKTGFLDTVFGFLNTQLENLVAWLEGMFDDTQRDRLLNELKSDISSLVSEMFDLITGAIWDSITPWQTDSEVIAKESKKFSETLSKLNDQTEISKKDFGQLGDIVINMIRAGKDVTSEIAELNRIYGQMTPEQQRGISASRYGSVTGQMLSKLRGAGAEFARGGVATIPSVFGEKGPEVAIPLDSGKKIPVAEVKGNMGQNEFKEMVGLLKQAVQRLEMQVVATNEVGNRINRLSSTVKKSGETVY